ncbi:NAD-dependent epimerase/dehydratase family protein [Roseospira navarrensis]|uniref:NAD-dependent epimerase/dehydratase family protein n=1 Tax=Roseospira navarrensis TaxID=140058 RepID=A0A7X1ZF43_9PROT|nr:NAD(P)-dependent oxidoreductase [Roseospira navarrensis]MQX37424.1 NAD-dependent epimerase/dehydratase family protein [Roseospira navarrensis]
MTERIFITGGSGLIGLTLARHLVDHGYALTLFDLGEQFARRQKEIEDLQARGDVAIQVGTIMDRWSVTLAAKGCTAVVHLAAMLGVRRTEENRLLCMDINVNGTENVLNACVQNGIGHFVLASSSEVYGEPTSNPVHEGVETKGKTVYAVSKLAAEELTKGYHQLHPSIDYTIVRFFNTYGEGQVAQFVVSRFVKRVLEGKNPQVYGDGSQVRSFCHVQDSVEGVRAILENPVARNRVFNIGNSREVFTLTEAARKVIATLKPDSGLSVDYVPLESSDRAPEREILIRYCDNSLAVKDLGFAPKVTLEEGIRRIADSVIHDNWTNWSET